jgi:hypothetical protein
MVKEVYHKEDPTVNYFLKEVTQYEAFISAVKDISVMVLNNKIATHLGVVAAFFTTVSGLIIYIYLDETNRQKGAIEELKRSMVELNRSVVLLNSSLNATAEQAKINNQILMQVIKEDE